MNAWVAGEEDVATTWTYEFRPVDAVRTEVTESFDSRRLRHPDWADALAGRRDLLVDDLRTTLHGLQQAAERRAVS